MQQHVSISRFPEATICILKKTTNTCWFLIRYNFDQTHLQWYPGKNKCRVWRLTLWEGDGEQSPSMLRSFRGALQRFPKAEAPSCQKAAWYTDALKGPPRAYKNYNDQTDCCPTITSNKPTQTTIPQLLQGLPGPARTPCRKRQIRQGLQNGKPAEQRHSGQEGLCLKQI